MLWLKRLWGQVRWDGTGAPWERAAPKCPLCPLHHGTTVHNRLIHRMRWILQVSGANFRPWHILHDVRNLHTLDKAHPSKRVKHGGVCVKPVPTLHLEEDRPWARSKGQWTFDGLAGNTHTSAGGLVTRGVKLRVYRHQLPTLS